MPRVAHRHAPPSACHVATLKPICLTKTVFPPELRTVCSSLESHAAACALMGHFEMEALATSSFPIKSRAVLTFPRVMRRHWRVMWPLCVPSLWPDPHFPQVAHILHIPCNVVPSLVRHVATSESMLSTVISSHSACAHFARSLESHAATGAPYMATLKFMVLAKSSILPNSRTLCICPLVSIPCSCASKLIIGLQQSLCAGIRKDDAHAAGPRRQHRGIFP